MTTEAAAIWLEEQLRASVARVEALTRDVGALQSVLASRERELLELREQIAVLDGRTRRHDAAQDVVRELQQAIAGLASRLDDEAGVRREQRAAAERAHDAEQDAQAASGVAVEALTVRLVAAEQTIAALSAREAQLLAALADRETAGQEATGRLDALAGEVEVLGCAARRDGDALERLSQSLVTLEAVGRALEARTQQTQQDQRRVEDELLTLARLADREQALADVLEQQRALRQQVEGRIDALDARLTAGEAAQTSDAEWAGLLRHRLVRVEEQIAVLASTVEGQREALLDHFRRATIAAGDAGRRQAEEIERQARAAQELLVRLAEGAERASREQPL